MSATTTESSHVDARSLIEGQRALIAVESTQPTDQLRPDLVPGLMQTQAYARAALTLTGVFTPEQVEEAVRIRAERVRALYDSPVQHRFLLSDDGLHKPVVGPDALAEQHTQIAHLAGLDHVRVRVLAPGARRLTPYLLRGNRVYMEGPGGLNALPDGQYPAYAAHFEDLWEAAHPYSG